MQDKTIDSFWKWFNENKDKIESDNYNPTILDHLDKTISDWNLDWEVGPGQFKRNSLTISPDGDEELLPLTEHIIDRSPSIDNWEFYSTKQPKANWNLLELTQNNISVNASEWEYVILKYDDGKIEILVKADDLKSYDKETKEIIVKIVLTNLLGEKLFMQQVDYFDIVDEFDGDKGITEIRYLPEHLKKLFE